MRVIFMGTPLFALDTLKSIHQHHEVIGVFVQPDKPNMRGKQIQFSPIKQYAIEHSLPLFQPKSIKKEESIELIKSLAPDIIVVAAYGKLLPQSMLDIPPLGVINVHASLLPKYRGASPIHQALLSGDSVTGITIMNMILELDAGEMILKKETPITQEDNFETVHHRLALLGAQATIEALQLIEENKAIYTPQDSLQATFCGYITKEDMLLDFSLSTQQLLNIIKTFSPTPGAYCFYQGKRVKIFTALPIEKNYHALPGTIVDFVKKEGYLVKTSDGALLITALQPENKKRISGQDALNAQLFTLGEYFLPHSQ